MAVNEIIHERITFRVIAVVLLYLCISENTFHFVDGASALPSQRNSITNPKSSDRSNVTIVSKKPWIAGVNNLRVPFLQTASAPLSKALPMPLKPSQDKRSEKWSGAEGAKRGGTGTILLKSGIGESHGEKVSYANPLNSIQSPFGKAYRTGVPEDIEEFLVQFINSKPELNNSNLDVIIQAFRFVKLDSILNALVDQLTKLQQSHEALQSQTVKQDTKFELVMDQIKTLVNSVSGESAKQKEKEGRIETEIEKMNHRLDQAVEKIIKSSSTSHMMLELSKESLQQMDKVEGISNEVLKEVKAVKTELGDVGQVSIQTIYNIHKLEENLMSGFAEMGNRTIYALRQDGKIIETSVLLEDRNEGNFIQADGSSNPGGGFPSSVKKVPEHTLSGLGRSSSNGGGESRTNNTTTTNSKSISEGNASKAESLVSCLSRKRLINGRPKDCGDIQLLGHSQNGVYRIFPLTITTSDDGIGVEVYCDLETKGGGWTVIQRRTDHQVPKENFYRTLPEYSKGFGSPYNQYWIGLINIAEITESGNQELRIELTDWDGSFREANYAYFRVSNSTDKFRLHIADYTGSAGDSLAYHNGMAFSTKDQDNDLDKAVNCAQRYQGAWWYKSCHQSNLNGVFMENKGKHESYAMGINWYSWRGYYYSLRRAEMKVRNRNFYQQKHLK